MSNWDDHRLILAVHRGGTLRAAADMLKVTHTTVARRLAALEEAQSTPLFVRSGRSYTISDYGLQRVAIAEKIEVMDFAAQRLHRSATDSLSGPLSVSVPRAFLQFAGLLDVIDGFVEDHPDIELTLVGDDSIADLDRGQADVVLRGQIGPDAHLVGRLISPVSLQFYGRRSYLEGRSPEEYEWIGAPFSKGETPKWLAGSPFPNAPIRYVIDDIVSRYKAVADGLGIGRLGCFMADPEPELVPIGQAAPLPYYDLWVLTHPDLRETPKVKALMQWIWDALRKQRPLLIGESRSEEGN